MRHMKLLPVKTDEGYWYIQNPEKAELLVIPASVALFHFAPSELQTDEDLLSWGQKEVEKRGTPSTAIELELRYALNKYRFLKKGGYLCSEPGIKAISGRLDRNRVIKELANCSQITIEVTEACNLSCKYCGYGDLYSSDKKRGNSANTLPKVRSLLEYLSKMKSRPDLCLEVPSRTHFGFYGGEPCLEMTFIRQCVQLIKDNTMFGSNPSFGITTNGTLLDHCYDFFVENDFQLTVSLDGDQRANQYRVDHKGRQTGNKVMKNLKMLKDSCPDYFSKRVRIFSVVHDKNEGGETTRFFRNELGKDPQFFEIRPYLLDPSKAGEFRAMYRSVLDECRKDECEADPCLQQHKTNVQLPWLAKVMKSMLWQMSETIEELGRDNSSITRIPTGTCLPFSKKIFLTTKGDLLPCERIGNGFVLGKVTDDRVDIDFAAIANEYNSRYDKFSAICKDCWRNRSCPQCMFYAGWRDESPNCESYSDAGKTDIFLQYILSLIERNPQLSGQILRNTIQR